MECSRAIGSASLVSATLHRAKTKSTAGHVWAPAEADPTARSRGGKPSQTKVTSPPANDASGRGSGDSPSHGGISGGCESFHDGEGSGQLHRDDSLRAQQRQATAAGKTDQGR